MKPNKLLSSLAIVGIVLATISAASFLGKHKVFPVSERHHLQVSSDTPLVVDRGFKALEGNNGVAALDTWLEGSLLENLPIPHRYQLSELLNIAGDYQGYTVISKIPITSHTQLVYVESQHELGPMYWRFAVYDNNNQSLVTDLNVNTDPLMILPGHIVFAKIDLSDPRYFLSRVDLDFLPMSPIDSNQQR